MDEDLKKSMEQAFDEIGLSITAAFAIFAKKVEKDVYFLKYLLISFIPRAIRKSVKKSLEELTMGKLI